MESGAQEYLISSGRSAFCLLGQMRLVHIKKGGEGYV
jgi:hypothetical protein